MRIFLVVGSLSVALAAQAQPNTFNAYEPGCYTLKSAPSSCQPGQLKLQFGQQLLVKTPANQTLQFLPAQISSFRIGKHKFTTAQHFRMIGSASNKEVTQAFVEQVDSGRVMLLRYHYDVVTSVPASKDNIPLTVSSVTSAYLLHQPGTTQYTPVQNPRLGHGVPSLHEAAKPFFASRPDLVEALADKRTTIEHLPALVRALNTGEAYTMPR